MSPCFLSVSDSRQFPLAGIANLPTPLERLDPHGALDFGAEAVYVKRDDHTSPVYGGNKVRKLDLLLGDALAQGRSTVLTFGAYGSNHALATAVHARALGLEPHVVLSPQDPGPFAPRTLLAHAALGTVIHLVDGWDGRREAVVAKRELTERDGIEPYIIPMGGTCPLGVVGYMNAAIEVVDAGLVPDVVYVAAGTLGTAVGLALGFAWMGITTTTIEAVRVTPDSLCNRAVADDLAIQTLSLLGMDEGGETLSLDDAQFSLRDEFFEPGYGVVTPQTTAAVVVAHEHGLHLETTYTGKAFSAMLDDGRAGKLDGKQVLFWDTYNSAPYPKAGDESLLPLGLQDYIERCRQLFPDVSSLS